MRPKMPRALSALAYLLLGVDATGLLHFNREVDVVNCLTQQSILLAGGIPVFRPRS
jgi:hypothetical protein